MFSLIIRRQMEWNVPIYTSLTLTEMLRAANSFVIRVMSSFAAFSVKVAINICSGATPHSRIRYIARCTSVKVFPVPGPAVISTGPSVVEMAFCWPSLAFSKSYIWHRSYLFSAAISGTVSAISEISHCSASQIFRRTAVLTFSPFVSFATVDELMLATTQRSCSSVNASVCRRQLAAACS